MQNFKICIVYWKCKHFFFSIPWLFTNSKLLHVCLLDFIYFTKGDIFNVLILFNGRRGIFRCVEPWGTRGKCPWWIKSEEGAYSPSKYAPVEIRNNMFLPLMKKLSFEGIGADAETSLSLVIIRYYCLLYPRGRTFLGGLIFSIFLSPPPPSYKQILPLIKKNPGHASVRLTRYYWENYFLYQLKRMVYNVCTFYDVHTYE